MIDAQGPLAAFVVDDVAVDESHVIHCLAQLGANAQGMSDFVPKDTIPGDDAARFTLMLVRFHNDQVIQGTDEAALHGHVAAVADIDAVRVGAVSEQLHVADLDAIGLADWNRPRTRVAQNPMACDPKIGSPDRTQRSSVAFFWD
jgi:hypothetical protein